MTQYRTAITGQIKPLCDETLLRGHRCFCFATDGMCDSCMKQLCNVHKHVRQTFTHKMLYHWILCAHCAKTFDSEREFIL